MESLAGIIGQAPNYLIALSGIVTSLTVLTALTPTQIDDKWLGKATGAINFLLKIANMGAGNVGKNKNQDEQALKINVKAK